MLLKPRAGPEPGDMGSRTCGGCLSALLVPLALWSITVNILLYFPNGQTSYAASSKLTNYVWYFEGICFSGVMVSVALEAWGPRRGASLTQHCLVKPGVHVRSVDCWSREPWFGNLEGGCWWRSRQSLGVWRGAVLFGRCRKWVLMEVCGTPPCRNRMSSSLCVSV